VPSSPPLTLMTITILKARWAMTHGVAREYCLRASTVPLCSTAKPRIARLQRRPSKRPLFCPPRRV
jgi:hypothetical protein